MQLVGTRNPGDSNPLGAIEFYNTATSSGGAVLAKIAALEQDNIANNARLAFYTTTASPSQEGALKQAMSISDWGGVAIGVPQSNTFRLEVGGAIQVTSSSDDSGATSDAAWVLGPDGGPFYDVIRRTKTGNNLAFDTYNGASWITPLTITSTGKVGVGAANPAHALVISTPGTMASQLQISAASPYEDSGLYFVSTGPNSGFMSTGASFDGSAGGWIQRSPDGNAVIQGSGTPGYRLFTSSGNVLNKPFLPSVRLHINYAGEFGINQPPVPGHEIHTSSGAYLASGTWTNASSRELKDNIRDLPAEAADQALALLKPVTFNYKTDMQWQHVGFVAEDVPDLVASPDRKGLSPMDIVAVLTKVVQEQKQELADQTLQLADQAHQLVEQTQHLAHQEQELQAERSRGDTMEKQLLLLSTEIEQLKAHGQ
jgi:hypothetical protein